MYVAKQKKSNEILPGNQLIMDLSLKMETYDSRNVVFMA
jgi:hypothetical protein